MYPGKKYARILEIQDYMGEAVEFKSPYHEDYFTNMHDKVYLVTKLQTTKNENTQKPAVQKSSMRL